MLFLFLLLFGGMNAYAQVPGYLGKKFTIDATFQSFPAINGPTAKNKGYTIDQSIALNWRAAGTLGYTISRTRQLILTGDFLHTGMYPTTLFGAVDPNDPYGSSTYDVFYDLKGKSVGFGLRTFSASRGAIAPWGTYHAWTLQATMLKGEIVPKYAEYSAPPGSFEDFDPKFTYWSLGYEMGQNFIVNDFLVLNLGFRLNIPLQLNLISLGETFETNEDAFKHAVFARMAGHSLVTINVGAGVVF